MISLEICRRKFDPETAGKLEDEYNETVEYLKSQGYEIYTNMPHTKDLITYEVIFIKKGMEFPGKEHPENLHIMEYWKNHVGT